MNYILSPSLLSWKQWLTVQVQSQPLWQQYSSQQGNYVLQGHDEWSHLLPSTPLQNTPVIIVKNSFDMTSIFSAHSSLNYLCDIMGSVSCIRSYLIYDSKIWLITMKHEVELDRTDMCMFIWINGITLKERKTKSETCSDLNQWVWQLRKVCNAEHHDNTDCICKLYCGKGTGMRQRGWLRKTWGDSIKKSMRSPGLSKGDTLVWKTGGRKLMVENHVYLKNYQ